MNVWVCVFVFCVFLGLGGGGGVGASGLVGHLGSIGFKGTRRRVTVCRSSISKEFLEGTRRRFVESELR